MFQRDDIMKTNNTHIHTLKINKNKKNGYENCLRNKLHFSVYERSTTCEGKYFILYRSYLYMLCSEEATTTTTKFSPYFLLMGIFIYFYIRIIKSLVKNLSVCHQKFFCFLILYFFHFEIIYLYFSFYDF